MSEPRCDECLNELVFVGRQQNGAEEYDCPVCRLRSENQQLRADMQTALQTIRPLASAMGAQATLKWCDDMEAKYATPETTSK